VNIDSKKKGRKPNKKVAATHTAKKIKPKGSKIGKKNKGGSKATTAAKSRNAQRPQPRKTNKSAIKPHSGRRQTRKNVIAKVPPRVTGTVLPGSRIQLRNPPSTKSSVYVLELEDGRVYVGSSKDVPRRVSQHLAGSGSAYTRLYRPTGVQLPRLGNIEGDGDAAERDETLRYMMLRGIPYVRGWKFARVEMPPEEFDEAESNIRELFDLCRRCGYKGHFCTYCKATFDRLGNPVGRW
jgi:predicted GIY-YIG superfamily endonuclease